jgi:hypothetical protein
MIAIIISILTILLGMMFFLYRLWDRQVRRCSNCQKMGAYKKTGKVKCEGIIYYDEYQCQYCGDKTWIYGRMMKL